jgi:hypothetical protein
LSLKANSKDVDAYGVACVPLEASNNINEESNINYNSII